MNIFRFNLPAIRHPDGLRFPIRSIPNDPPSGKGGPEDDTDRGDDDWEAGDIAECMTDGWWINGRADKPFYGLKKGDRLQVERVVSRDHRTSDRRAALCFSCFPGKTFTATGFRKVRPQADEETAADEAFIQLLRSTPQSLPATPVRELEEVASLSAPSDAGREPSGSLGPKLIRAAVAATRSRACGFPQRETV